jgi:hypothetical protein
MLSGAKKTVTTLLSTFCGTTIKVRLPFRLCDVNSHSFGSHGYSAEKATIPMIKKMVRIMEQISAGRKCLNVIGFIGLSLLPGLTSAL